METNELPQEQEKVPTKRERLEKILDILKKGPLGSSAEEVYNFISTTFETFENKYSPTEDDKMNLLGFEGIPATSYKGHTIYFEFFTRHVLFISENGAFDIRVRDDNVVLKDELKKQPSYVREHMKLVLEKPGFDGNGVWD
jgi:hypothetical protein